MNLILKDTERTVPRHHFRHRFSLFHCNSSFYNTCHAKQKPMRTII